MSKCLYVLILLIPVTLCDIDFPCDLTNGSCFTAVHKLLLKMLVGGYPTLNILSSDPLQQEKIQISSPNMVMTLTDAYMYGTRDCEIDQVTLEASTWTLKLICPKLTLKSDYEMNGDVDSTHIEGKGKCEVIYDNYIISMNGRHETITGDNSIGYYNITSYEMVLTDVQGATYKFTNLFNGDNEKSMQVHQYINSNWKELHNIIGEPIIYNLIGYFVNNVNKFLELVPKSEVFNIPMAIRNIPLKPLKNLTSLKKNPFMSFI